MLAWQHGAYIAEAIDSILAQKYGGELELLIGEDKSSDNTLEICEQYQLRYPRTIQVVTGDTNVGMHENFARLWRLAGADYVALCEGDDYWTEPLKLEKEVAFLEANPDCALCGTFTRKIARDDAGDWVTAGEVRPALIKEKYTFEELIGGYHFHFSSVLLRRAAVAFPDWFKTVYCVDRPLYLLAAANGKAGLVPEVTSVYRLHPGGNWSSLSPQARAQRSTDLFLKMRDHFDPRYRRQFERSLGVILWSYMAEDLSAGRLPSARRIFWQSLRYTALKSVLAELARYCRVMLLLYRPASLRRVAGGRA
jgi:glycosyltransferase involved in cell wall biosynthesis